jgi:signal recognition particle subunit SRP54
MFNSLSKGLSDVIRKISSGSVDKKAVEEVVQDIRKVLLQSDVDTDLVNRISQDIRMEALEKKPASGMTMREHVLKVIYDNLVSLLGGKPASLAGKKRIMMVGLFGSGKTTTIGKLARYFVRQGMKPGLVALDFHRPAAPQQLEQLGGQINAPVYVDPSRDVYKAAENGMEKLAKSDVIIFDTAGRNALDAELADEVRRLGEMIKPDEVLLAIPADLGKVAKAQAEQFHRLVGVTGVVITKMDGTAKAGGALAAASVTGAKVKFIGTVRPDQVRVQAARPRGPSDPAREGERDRREEGRRREDSRGQVHARRLHRPDRGHGEDGADEPGDGHDTRTGREGQGGRPAPAGGEDEEVQAHDTEHDEGGEGHA